MPKSVRVSDELYRKLEQESEIMHRSLGAQLEYLARLGLAVERSPHLSARDLHALLSSVEHATPPAEESMEDLFSRLSHLDGNPTLMEQLKARDDALEVIDGKAPRRPRRQRKAG